RRRRGIGFVPRVERRSNYLGLALPQGFEARFFARAGGAALAQRFVDVARQPDHHDDAAVLLQTGKYVVGHVARMAIDAARARVAENYWRFGYCQCIQHRRLADVAEIDEHSEPLHFAYD